MDTLERENDALYARQTELVDECAFLRAQNEGWAQERAELVRRAEQAEASERENREQMEYELARQDERVLEAQRTARELEQQLEDAKNDRILVDEALNQEMMRRRTAEKRAREGDEEFDELGGFLNRLKKKRKR